jgi:hypothetical protein
VHYRLGSIPTLSIPPDLERFFEGAFSKLRSGGAGRRNRSPEGLGEMFLSTLGLDRLLSRRRPEPRPDLLESLPSGSPDRGWVEETAGVLEAMNRRGSRVLLLRCEWEPGRDDPLAIAGFDRSLCEEVRRRDEVSAGFAAVRSGGGGVRVLPRIYRKVCANGAVVFVREGEDAVATEGSVAGAIGACLRKEVFGEVVEDFRRAARVRVDDASSLLAAARAAAAAAEVLPVYERAGDRTGWGLLNAATAVARREPSFPRRVHLERDAERILRVLGSRNAGSRGGGVDLAATGSAAPGAQTFA